MKPMPQRHPQPRRAAPLTERELWVRACALHGASVGELARALGRALPPDERRAKGYVGALVECALGADPTAADRPDFPALGVELKTIPVDAHGRVVESTFCCSIAMARADVETWEGSRLARRLARVLWVPVQAAKVAPLGARLFGAPLLWSPSERERAQLAADWELLMGRVGAGLPLTAHLGEVLQVRPKASTGAVRRLAAHDDAQARVLPLGFYLRARFTRGILAQTT